MSKEQSRKKQIHAVLNHASSQQSTGKKNCKVYATIGVIALLIIIGAVFYFMQSSPINPNFGEDANLQTSDVAATINFGGERLIVNMSTVLEMEKIAKRQNLSLNRSFVIERLSQIEVLKAQARHLNISANPMQVELTVSSQLKTLDAQGLDMALAAENMTRESFVSGLRTSIAQEILFQQLFQQEVVSKIQISDEQLKQIYDANLDKFQAPESVYVKHILICYAGATACVGNMTKTQANLSANAVYATLLKDNSNATFASIAQTQSTDVGSAQKGGDLGPITRGITVPEFEKVAFSTPVGQVSAPFESSFGYHILTVYKQQAAQTLSFDIVSEDLRKQVVLQRANSLQQTYIDSLMAVANVTVSAK